MDALAPLLNSWIVGKNDNFSLAKQDSFDIELTTEDGFYYGIDSEKVSVAFGHRMKIKPVSGSHPIVEMLSHPEPFTKLLPEVCKRVLDAANLVIDPKIRLLERIGIVSTTVVSEDEAPPGICRFIQYMSQPWDNKLDFYNFQVVSNLSENADWSDRCIHQITKTEASEELVTLKFDWQRIFKEKKSLTSIASLKGSLVSAQEASLDYFEQLAEGNRFDREIISKPS
ncbi:MAG: hypothetical protein AABY81_02155 [Pseudomonadota bacterium]